MKHIVISLIAVFFITACGQQPRDVVTQSRDTIVIESDNYIPVLAISESKKKLIDSFRPPLRDIAYYMILNKEKITVDYYCFKCGKYEFWIANDFFAFKLYKPFEMNLTDSEKYYFYELFNNYRNNVRLFKYENEVQIILTK